MYKEKIPELKVEEHLLKEPFLRFNWDLAKKAMVNCYRIPRRTAIFLNK